MTPITRRAFLAGSATAAATLAAGPYVHAQKKGGLLRVVPHADLKVLDPIWTTGYITRNHGYMIFDTLFAMDSNLKAQPQMVEKWTASANKMKWPFALRDGLKFHDGQPVTAEDCVLSIKRWGARDALGRVLMGSIGRRAAVDKKTFAIDLEQPFGLVLEALGKPSSNVPFIMPARLAATDANAQVKERGGRWQARARGPRGVALHPGCGDGQRRARGGGGGLLGEHPARLRPQARAEPERRGLRERHPRQPGPAPAPPSPAALQQQEGGPGPPVHGGPQDLSRHRRRQRQVLQGLPGRVHVRRDAFRVGGGRAEAGPGEGPPAPQGQRL